MLAYTVLRAVDWDFPPREWGLYRMWAGHPQKFCGPLRAPSLQIPPSNNPRSATELVGMLCCISVRAAFIASNTSGSSYTHMDGLSYSLIQTNQTFLLECEKWVNKSRTISHNTLRQLAYLGGETTTQYGRGVTIHWTGLDYWTGQTSF